MAQREGQSVPTNEHFDGDVHLNWSEKRWYWNPNQRDLEALKIQIIPQHFRHRDIMSRITHQPRDLLRYIHPLTCKPNRMLVQATPDTFRKIEQKEITQGNWRRVSLKGHAPMLLSAASWVLGPPKSSRTKEDILQIAWKTVVTMPINIVYLFFPTGSATKWIQPYYDPSPCRSWNYPKYARNEYDAKPDAEKTVTFTPKSRSPEDVPQAADYDIIGEERRMRRPRRLVILKNEEWTTVDSSGEIGTDQPYIFVSYTVNHFNTKQPGRLAKLEDLARLMAKEACVNAYWLDCRCFAATQPQLSEDIHAIYDIVRGARQVCVMLPDLKPTTLIEWGKRMWTLPEALLTSQQTIKFCSEARCKEYTKLFLAASVWRDKHCRLLAEHYTGVLNLSRLELITIGLEALASRQDRKKQFFDGDVAYALMALLHHRPNMNPHDTLFQALARLSLANDSDRIVERMICLLPAYEKSSSDSFILHDQLGANLWDIEPLCQVAGVCDDREVILDGCRGISIRWTDIPEIVHHRRFAWKRLFAKMAVRSASLWFILGCVYTAMGTPKPSYGANSGFGGSSPSPGANSDFGGSFNNPPNPGANSGFSGNGSNPPSPFLSFGVPMLLLGIALLFYAPWGITTIYGGKIWSQSVHLIGFEGVLPIETIERKTFGNYIGRLSYAPSSNKLSQKEPDERVGVNPDWVTNHTVSPPALSPHHRFFTLIDTGSMTVSIFSAERPPSVALIAGKEGGMLRVVLCSFERGTNCLHKETVLRMETPMLDKSRLLGWVKVLEKGGIQGVMKEVDDESDDLTGVA
jgi:hypothetical protein